MLKDPYPDLMSKFPQLKEPETPLNPALQMSEDEEEEELILPPEQPDSDQCNEEDYGAETKI